MHTRSRFNSHSNHTVVLQPRGGGVSEARKNGLQQGYIERIRSADARSRPKVVLRSALAPPHMVRTQRVAPQTFTEQQATESDLLVRFGIDSYLGRMVTRMLIALTFFQPVYVAMGMELEDVSGIPTYEEEQAEIPQAETVADNLVENVESGMPEDIEQSESDDARADVENQTTEHTVNDEVSTDTTATDSDARGEGEMTEDEVAESSGGVSSNDSGDTTLEEEETSEEGEGVVDGEGLEQESATGDEESGVESNVESDVDATSLTEGELTDVTGEDVLAQGEIEVSQNPESKYVFGEGDCTLVAEGEFYCVAESIERQTTGDLRVYAEKDREGDREIYYFDGVEVQRVTNNSYDDFAPVFDDETMIIVWQAMVHDRLQIMVHELTTNTTRQVTSGRQNSSNPSIIGDTVVWQEWVDTNWEIMMTDVDNEGQAFEIERLTDNAVHDMFPAAYDGLITWQSERGSSWEVVVYDMRTEKKHTLEKSENTKYENPRFALLFDSKHDNGDVETIGYDLDTGEMTELGTKANPKPFVPVTPKEEVPEAIPQTTNSTNTVSKEDVDSGDDPVVE